MACKWHDHGMSRTRISTTVDPDLLARARKAHAGTTDASMVEAALEALLREHRAGEIDRDYERAYRDMPIGTPDEWGDLGSFLDEAARR